MIPVPALSPTDNRGLKLISNCFTIEQIYLDNILSSKTVVNKLLMYHLRIKSRSYKKLYIHGYIQ